MPRNLVLIVKAPTVPSCRSFVTPKGFLLSHQLKPCRRCLMQTTTMPHVVVVESRLSPCSRFVSKWLWQAVGCPNNPRCLIQIRGTSSVRRRFRRRKCCAGSCSFRPTTCMRVCTDYTYVHAYIHTSIHTWGV